jgi:ABC-2 type transport system permease protein
MWRIVMIHTARQMLREGVAPAAVLLLVLALLAGLVAGSFLYQKQEQVRAGIQEENDAHFQAMRAQLEAVAAGRKPEGFFFANRPTAVRYVIPRPVSPLTPLALGQSEYLPASASVSLFGSETALFEMASIDNAQHQQIGRIDAAFVLVYLLPLLLIALTYNLLSAERERGTLPLILNQPVALSSFLFAKALIPFLALMIPAITVPLIWMLAANPSAASWPQWLAFTAFTLGYGVLWTALAAAVNLLGVRSATNALLLGGCWLLFVLILPATLQAVLSSVYPVPSRLELITQARVAEVEHNQKRQEILDRFYLDHPDLIPESRTENRILAFYAASLETEKVVQPIHERFENQLAAQQAWVRRMQYLSPAVVYHEGLTAVAGTGRDGFLRFRKQVLEFREQVRGFLLPRVARSKEMSLADYDEAPLPPPPDSTLQRADWNGLVGLWLPALILVWWSGRRARTISHVFSGYSKG